MVTQKSQQKVCSDIVVLLTFCYSWVMAKTISKIAAETVDNLLAVFAGQTVVDDAVYAQIETSYAAARKRCSFGGMQDVLIVLSVHHGVTSQYAGANYTGTCSYTFPAEGAR